MFGWLKRKKKQELIEPPKYTPAKLMPLTNLVPAYQAEIERLENHLAQLVAETEMAVSTVSPLCKGFGVLHGLLCTTQPKKDTGQTDQHQNKSIQN